MSEQKTIITTTLAGSHVCISEEDYDLIIRAANTVKAFDKENAELKDKIEQLQKDNKQSNKLWEGARQALENSLRENTTLKESNKVLVEAICIYAREELGHVDFNDDKGAINFFIKAYSEEPKS